VRDIFGILSNVTELKPFTMSYSIEEIEGIGPEYGSKLRNVDIQTTEDLLRRCGDKKGREGVSTESGISEKHLLEWVNKADLMRINGVGEEFADLLEAAGVDTVNLAEAMAECNEKHKRCDRVPGAETVQDWIDQAKEMEPAVSH
jgi:predicted flap endonuclease-1-like 5' DNA nuclease